MEWWSGHGTYRYPRIGGILKAATPIFPRMDRAQVQKIIMTIAHSECTDALSNIDKLAVYLDKGQIMRLLRAIINKETYYSRDVVANAAKWLPLLNPDQQVSILEAIINVKDSINNAYLLLNDIKVWASFLQPPQIRIVLRMAISKMPYYLFAKWDDITPYFELSDMKAMAAAVWQNVPFPVTASIDKLTKVFGPKDRLDILKYAVPKLSLSDLLSCGDAWKAYFSVSEVASFFRQAASRAGTSTLSSSEEWKKYFTPEEVSGVISAAQESEAAAAAATAHNETAYASASSSSDDQIQEDPPSPTPDRSGFTKVIANIVQGMAVTWKDGRKGVYILRKDLMASAKDCAKEMGVGSATEEQMRKFLKGHEVIHAWGVKDEEIADIFGKVAALGVGNVHQGSLDKLKRVGEAKGIDLVALAQTAPYELRGLLDHMGLKDVEMEIVTQERMQELMVQVSAQDAEVEQDVGGIDYSKKFNIDERGAGIKSNPNVSGLALDPAKFSGFKFEIISITRKAAE
jgi:hypothetical protein